MNAGDPGRHAMNTSAEQTVRRWRAPRRVGRLFGEADVDAIGLRSVKPWASVMARARFNGAR